ncbi:polymorphic toxin-type HINT domain-containing protein [Solirubrobacter phytolaccae]|uniref:Polymorphic toxin-type HINT domain-containing protein n=1 Tax=Solirubrobacter phytolaccae TaxID=1404360 RepID=A0A9X3N5R5_9ACTN|nr:polymorphic toxin-type HINT domain-containing protein [Solirubrobacter phytolaccae]MDA0178749.1 polymorphic toxin-type HINT domain-containing protein [Solirubrobacter phytolaccae]
MSARATTAAPLSLARPVTTRAADGRALPTVKVAANPVDLRWRTDRRGGFSLAKAPADVRVGATAAAGAAFVEAGVGFAPHGAADVSGRHVDATVFFANVARDTDYLLAPRGGGLEAMWALRSAASPERLVLDYRLESGLSLRSSQDPDLAAVVVRGGKTVAMTSAVVAFDADRRPVPVKSTVVGDKLVIAVDHQGRDLRYPLLVDPTTYTLASGTSSEHWAYADQGVWASDASLAYLEINTYNDTSAGDWAEWTYTPPGTGYVTRLEGGVTVDYMLAENSESNAGLRRSNGTWAVPPVLVEGMYGEYVPVDVCLISSCDEPVAGDSPTSALSYFSGTKAVFRVDQRRDNSETLNDGWQTGEATLTLDDPEVPTLSSVSTGATGSGTTRTASATISDAGLGPVKLEVLKDGNVVNTVNRTCVPEAGACTGSWSPSINYSLSGIPQGTSATFGLRAYDAAGHVSSTSSWTIFMDTQAPTVTATGAMVNPVDPAASVQVWGQDGPNSSGIKRLLIDVDGVAQTPVTFSCSPSCSGSQAHTFSLTPSAYSEGLHTVTFRYEDAAGNVSSPLTRNVYVIDEESINRAQLGLENYFAYESTPTGAGTAAHVNVANGNAVWHSTPIVNAGRGLSSVVNLTYNSLDRGGYVNSLIQDGGAAVVGQGVNQSRWLGGLAYGEVGPGFSLGISGLTRLNEPLRRISGPSLDQPAVIELVDVDGTAHRFVRDASRMTRFAPPAGVELELRDYSSSDATRKWAATRPDGVTFFFDSDGYQTFITDRNGNTIRFEYEKYSKVTGLVSSCSGTPAATLLCTKRVVRVVDPYGVQHGGTTATARSLTISYKSGPTLPTGSHPSVATDALTGSVGGRPDKISRIVDHAGRVTDFGYDSAGYLTTLTQGEVLSPASTEHVRTTTFTYAGSGVNRQLASVVDPRGNDTTFTYETAAAPGLAGVKSVGQRATAVTNRRNNATTFNYGTNSCTSATAPGSVDTVYCYDSVGRVQEITDELGTLTELDWSSDNYMSRYKVAANFVDQAAETNITYTRLGDPETITDPLSRVTTLKYRFGTETGPTNGGVDDGTQYVTDLISMRRPARANLQQFALPTVTFGLDNEGNVTSRTYAGLASSETNYGSYGLVNWEEDEHDNRTSFSAYDANGLPTVVVDPRQNGGETSYDGTWRYSYDPVGNLLAVIDPRGGTSFAAEQPYTTYFEYDPFDRVIESYAPKCTDPSDDEDEGCPVKTWIRRSTAYDPNGNPTDSTDGRRKVTTRVFTAMDAVSRELTPEVNHYGEEDPAAEETAYEYDARDNLILVTSPEGSQSGSVAGDHATAYEYDPIDRLVIEQRQQRGSVSKDLITSYAYDRRDNVVGIADPRANTSGDAKANAADNAKQRWAYGYDLVDNRTDAIENPKTSGGLKLRTYTTYDANDNVASMVTPRGMTPTGLGSNAAEFTTTYVYDVHDDVISTTRGGQRTTAYTRRADGKVTAVISPRGVASTGVEGDFQTSYTYDRNGDVATVTLPRAPGQVPARAAKIKYGRNAVGDPIDIKDPRGNDEGGSPAPPAHYFSNRFYDTGELRWTDRPSWWTVEIGAASEVRERTPDEWILFDGNQPALPSGPGDFGKVTGMPLPSLLPMAGATTLRYDPEMRLESVVDAANKVIDLRRDDVDRVKGVEYPYKADNSATPANDPVRIPTELGYDRNGNLVMSEDGEGERTVTEFDQFDRWNRRTAPGAAPDGGSPTGPGPSTFEDEVTEATWDANGNQTVYENARHKLTTRTFDPVDRLESVTDPLDHVTTYAYDANGNQTCVRTPRGNSSSSRDCAAGDFATTSTFTRFDEVATSVQQADYTGESDQVISTSYAYDLDGNQITMTAPGARRGPGGGLRTQVTERRYDGAGRPWIVMQGTEHAGDGDDDAFDDRTVTVMEYDLAGNLRRVVNPTGAPDPEDIDLDNPGAALAELTTDNGAEIPPTGNNPPATSANYHATIYSLDEDNLLIRTWMPVGGRDADDNDRWRQWIERDDRGRVEYIDAPYKDSTAKRARTGYFYYDNGWIRESTDAHVINPADTESVQDGAYTYDYDKRGNQVQWDAAGPRSVSRTYYPNGLLLRRVATGDSTGPRRYSYGYNANRAVIRVRDTNDDRETHTSYDDADRRIEVDQVDESTGDDWEVDKDTKFTYDADGNITARRTDGNLSGGSYSGGKISTFEYDSVGRERKLTVDTPDQPDRITRTTWWASGRKANIIRQNGEVCQRTYYDTQGRVTGRERTTNADERDCEHSETRYRFFEYDTNGNRVDEYRWNSNHTVKEHYNRHDYNSRDQLVKWTRGVDARPVDGETMEGSTVKYKVNGAGAILEQLDEREDNHSIKTEFDVTGYRMTSATVEDSDENPNDPETRYFKYDTAGNLGCIGSTDDDLGDVDACAGGNRYKYDGFSRLSVTEGTGADKRFQYDGLDRRENECGWNGSGCDTGTSREFNYIGLGEQLSWAREPGSSTSKTQTFDYDSDFGRIGQATDSTTGHDYHSYFTDPTNGTVIGLEDSAGSIGTNDRYDLDPYGKQEDKDTPSPEAGENPFRFQSHHYDSGLQTYDMQARAYLPSFGRFTTADRFEDALGDFALQSDPLTQERYAFGAGNPVNRVEFDGHGPGSEGGAQPIIQSADGTTQRKRGEAPEETAQQTAARHDTFNGRSAADAYNKDKANENAQNAGGALGQAQPERKPVPEARCTVGCVYPIYSAERQRELAAGRKAFFDGIKFIVGDNPIEIASNFAGGPLGRVGGKLGGHLASKYGDDAWRAGKKAFGGGDDAVDKANDANKARKRSNTTPDCNGRLSFAGETPVLMADGTTRPISEVKVGDSVMALDPRTGERGPRRVTAVWVHDDLLIDLVVGGEALATTEDHPFWNVSDQAWQKAADVDAGDLVLSATGERLVVDGLWAETMRRAGAYNLTVDGLHTYFVGRSSILVHNDDCIPWSNPQVKSAANRLKRGADQVTVRNRSEAEELFLRVYQGDGYRNTTGWQPSEANRVLGSKRGTYHWDTDFGPNDPHSSPHLQVHTKEGNPSIVRIFFGE